MKQTLYSILLLLTFTLGLNAQDSSPKKPGKGNTKELADKAYAEEHYDEAASLYLELTKKGESADVFYNLGNCYYRLDDIGNAILWYERAFMLSPGDGDIRFNLQLARTKTIDKIVPEEEIFFVRWYHSLLNTMSVNGWVWTGIFLFIAALAGLLLYFFAQSIVLRKLGFYGAVVLMLFVVLSNIFAFQQHGRSLHHDRAIVLQGSSIVKSTPAQGGTDLFLLHAGTTMQILDNTMKDWYQIRLSDGKEGWISAHDVETI